MLKDAICFNILLILVVSLYLITRALDKKSDLIRVRKVVVAYIILGYISLRLCISDIVDMSWEGLAVGPWIYLQLFLLLLSLISISQKIEISKNDIPKSKSTKKYIIACLVPVLIFLIPYIYELYIINNCDYLLTYRTSGGVFSTESVMAIINNNTATVTLQENLFERTGISTEVASYEIVYNDTIEISMIDENDEPVAVENELIEQIASDARERNSSASVATVEYLAEGGYAIVRIKTDESYNEGYKTYLYLGDTCEARIRKPEGTIKEVTYYE